MKYSSSRTFFVCLVPMLFLVLCLHLKFSTGPYYLGNNNDPAYLYLVNSLYILDGLAPDFIQHPGTTLQLLGAVVIRCMAGTIPFAQLPENVYRNPEHYLQAIYYCVLGFNIVSLFALGRYALLKSGRVFEAILVQSSVFLISAWSWQGVSEGDIPVVANVNAEDFFIAITNIYGLLLLKLYFAQKEGGFKSSTDLSIGATGMPKGLQRLAGALGFIGAVGVVTKTIFLAWALAPVCLVKSWKERCVFILAFSVGVGMLTVPIWPNIGHMINWYTAALTHTGTHGSGSTGLVDLRILSENFRNIIHQNAFYSAVYFIIGFRVIWTLLEKYSRRSLVVADPLALRFTTVMCLAVLITMLFIARQCAGHYMVPTVSLLGVMCFFAGRTWPIAWGVLRAGLVPVIVLNAGLALMAATKLAQINTDIYNFSKKAYGEYKDAVICSYYRSSSPAFALQFGDENQGHLAYVEILQKIYPNTVFFHYWNRYFYDGRHVISYSDLKDRFGRVLLYGNRLPEQFNQSYIKVREIAASRSERLYEVQSVTIEDAIKAFYMSKVLEAGHRYAYAYALAKEAKSLGLSNIDPYMNDLLKKIIESP